MLEPSLVEFYPDEVWFDPSGDGQASTLCVAFVVWENEDDAASDRLAHGDQEPVSRWLSDKRGFWLLIGDRQAGQYLWMQRLAIIRGRAIYRSVDWPMGHFPERSAEPRVRLLSLHRRAGQ